MMVMSVSVPLVVLAILLIGVSFSDGQCIKSERNALLEFKRGLTDDSDMLASWDRKAGCCSWFGVICDDFTGHVSELHLQGYSGYDDSNLRGNISDSLLELKHLKYLDLSKNFFSEISIPEFFGFMLSLRFLNLSSASFDGKIPSSFGNLTSLNTLDLSWNYLSGEIPHELGNLSSLQYLSVPLDSYYTTYVEKLDWVSRLSSLKFLDLSSVNLSLVSNWPESLGKLPSLQQLHLSGCHLTQIPPISNVNFLSLSVLDLSYNQFNFSIPNDLFNGLTQLTFLDLSYNEFVGQIPSSIGNLTSLDTLVLSYNNFAGQIPTSFKSLCNLRSLSLQSTQLSQDFNGLIEILSYCVFHKLESLDLSSSQFSGYLSYLLTKFKSLISLDVSANSITGPLPISIGEMSSLTSLSLSYNKLNGSLPVSFGRLENLEDFDVSFNSLQGEVSEIHFKNLHNLLIFDATENHLVWKVSPDWVPPFQLVQSLRLGSCEVGPQFPTWLRHLKYLRNLNLSNSNINSPFPTWFFNFSSLNLLDLSDNQMYGIIPKISYHSNFIDLSSNKFKGPLPLIDISPDLLDLSNNLLSGSMHNFLCNKNLSRGSLMSALILKQNHLNGEIPDNCLMNYGTDFTVLELSNNNFSGNIPISIGRSTNLTILSLRNNSFTGEIPSTLQYCTGILALDLGENELSGEIPSWLGERLTELKILNIRGNKLSGHMSKKMCKLSKLQIMDVADNNLNGTIPTCVGNLKGMSQIISSSKGRIEAPILFWGYMENAAVVRKGQMVEYSTALDYVQSFDLSNNHFVGEIPQGITNLLELQSLNLSRNFLTGRIPGHIDAMQKLESLDLSQNRLSGGIPPSMSSMHFLSYLNLSNNNLSGQIPTSTQLKSMDPSSFRGNNLCGPPLTKDCNNKEATPPSNSERREDDGRETRAVDWFYFYVSLVPGFVVGFWCIVRPLAYNMRWKRAYYNFLDLLWDKIWVWFHVNIVRFVRNYGS